MWMNKVTGFNPMLRVGRVTGKTRLGPGFKTLKRNPENEVDELCHFRDLDIVSVFKILLPIINPHI